MQSSQEYLVMECHPAYAILLDEQGRFIKAANLNYEVGQRVTEVILMEEEPTVASKAKASGRIARRAVGAFAACLCLVLLGIGYFIRTGHATVELYMGPAVSLEVNREGEVVSMTPLNPEGGTLLEEYTGTDREIQSLCHALVALSIEQGYAPPETGYSLSVQASEKSWSYQLESSLWQQMATLTDTTILVLPVP